MLSEEEVRNDLNDIKYYYSRKDLFDEVSDSIGSIKMLEKIELYNKAICNANPRLYDVYVSLYLKNERQDLLADKLGYTLEYVSRLNTKLIRFFQENINYEEK